jgi:LSD1 subclass zinc finger protein
MSTMSAIPNAPRHHRPPAAHEVLCHGCRQPLMTRSWASKLFCGHCRAERNKQRNREAQRRRRKGIFSPPPRRELEFWLRPDFRPAPPRQPLSVEPGSNERVAAYAAAGEEIFSPADLTCWNRPAAQEVA